MTKRELFQILTKWVATTVSTMRCEIERLRAENERLRADKYTVWATYPDC